jgi:hypothetical protein
MTNQEVIDILLKVVQIIVIGFSAAYIAYQQYRTNHQKLLLDLYDRRIKIYNYVMGLVLIAGRGGNFTEVKAKFDLFYEHACEADFLFSSRLSEKINEIRLQASNLIAQTEINEELELHKELKPEDREKLIKIREWFQYEREMITPMFKQEISQEFLKR